MANARARTAKTTVTSFRVIETLRDRDRAGVTAIADELGLAKGTVHKHLSTLEGIGYVVKEGREYRLGLGFLGLGVTARRRLDVYTAARGAVERLAKATGEVASLVVPEHGYGRYVYRVPNEGSLPHHDGDRVHLHASAGGKAILAYLPTERREVLFDDGGIPTLTTRTIATHDELERELRTVRDTRVAYDRGEEVAGWYCVASPITDAAEEAVGAVTVSAESALVGDGTRSQDVPGLVISTARAIENKLDTI